MKVITNEKGKRKKEKYFYYAKDTTTSFNLAETTREKLLFGSYDLILTDQFNSIQFNSILSAKVST